MKRNDELNECEIIRTLSKTYGCFCKNYKNLEQFCKVIINNLLVISSSYFKLSKCLLSA